MATDVKTGPGPVVGFILEQHLEEIAFLAVQRRYLLFAPDVPLDGLREHDKRIAAHRDGLLIGGPAGAELARGRLEEFDPWDVYAAAATWLETGAPAPEEILELMTTASSGNLAAWREALRRLPEQDLVRLLPPTATEEAAPEVTAALVFARSWHGSQDPAALPPLVRSECAELRRTVARVLGWGVADRAAASDMLEKLVDDPELPVARAALWSAVLLGSGEAVDHCRDLVRDGQADPFQVQTLGLLGEPRDCALVRPFLEKEDAAAAAARALGRLGSDQAVPWLIDLLAAAKDETTARAAVEGLEILLGELPAAPEEETEGAEGDAAGNAEEDFRRDLPDPGFLASWWAEAADGFSAGVPLLRGHARVWPFAAEDEPMESLWLTALRGGDPRWDWLKREIPDGFFTAGEAPEALPGE